MIDPTDPRPPFRQIADDLRRAIASGEYSPGDRVPSERELVERYGTAPQTVRQAISLLKTEGLLTGQPGRGVFVRKPPLKFRLHVTHWVLTQARAQGLAGEVRLLGVEVVEPPAEIAARWPSQPGPDEAVVRRYLILLDDQPAQLINSYWPAHLANDTPIAGLDHITPGRIDAILRARHGIEGASFQDDLTVRMPTPEETRALQLLPGTPVVSLLRTYLDAQGAAFEVGDFLIAGDKHTLVYEGQFPKRPVARRPAE
ncbi:MAG: GntR family transcriptional regulator [Egibacteraceae bacterium]